MVATLRALTPIFGRNNRPTRQAVRAIVDKFETKFTLLDVPVPKRRRIFSNWALAKLEENEEFHLKIIFSDEAHFWLNGFVNNQNMRYWSAKNPNVLLETPLHPQKVTVWCGFHAGGVIRPYFFVEENDRHVTVNGERYRAMLEDYLWPESDEIEINDMWFQQDGATSHTAPKSTMKIQVIYLAKNLYLKFVF